MRRSLSLREVMLATALVALALSVEGPRWIADRKRSREDGALRALERIAAAEVRFRESKARFASLDELVASGFVDAQVARSARGYRIDAAPGDAREAVWWATASPDAPWDGDRSYAVSGATGSVFETTSPPAIDPRRGEPVDRSKAVATVATWHAPDRYFEVLCPGVIFYTTAATFTLETSPVTLPVGPTDK